MPAARCRSQLARHTTVLHRKREAFRQCSTLSIRVARSRLARPGAQALSSRVSPHPEIQPAQWRLLACHVSAGCALEVTAVSSHHGLAPKDRGLPPMQSPSTVRGPITTSAARRARAASLPISPPPERQPAQWRSIACYVNAGCALEVTALSLHHGLAPKERGLPPVQYPSTARKPTKTSAARRARVESLRVSPSPGSGACSRAT